MQEPQNSTLAQCTYANVSAMDRKRFKNSKIIYNWPGDLIFQNPKLWKVIRVRLGSHFYTFSGNPLSSHRWVLELFSSATLFNRLKSVGNWLHLWILNPQHLSHWNAQDKLSISFLDVCNKMEYLRSIWDHTSLPTVNAFLVSAYYLGLKNSIINAVFDKRFKEKKITITYLLHKNKNLTQRII